MPEAAEILSEREWFERVLDCADEGEAAAILSESHAVGPDLADRVLTLYRSSRRLEGILPETPGHSAAEWPEVGGVEGDKVGNYQLVRVLGEGGFGVVWLAEQREPVRRSVALKILKLGMDSRAVVARFENERQALAMMDHPNVARIHEAGCLPGGRPFYVMEFIDGRGLFKYADDHLLDLNERIHLVQQVADALQHAHQKGVIHRDLKPSNLMVVVDAGGPRVKVIDFGVARMMNEPNGESTLAGQRWGTPAYMSPEQLAGQPVDTRTDIFSLGLTLYELAAGVRARAGAGLENGGAITAPSRRFQRLPISEQTDLAIGRGMSPRQLVAALRGDLDWILLKAAAVDPGARYETVGAMRDDLARYLAGGAVLAGPPSLRYRAGKYVRRNMGKLLIAAVAVVSLAAVSIVSVVYARRAARAQQGMGEALYGARLTEARALRQTGRPGQRVRALAAIAEAARIHNTSDLRNEALAALALPDLEVVASMDVMPRRDGFADYDFESDLLAVGTYQNPPIRRYHLLGGTELPPCPLPEGVRGFLKFRLAPGGRRAAGYGMASATESFTSLGIVDTETGRLEGLVFNARSDREPAVFFDGGKRLAVGLRDGGLALCDGITGKPECVISADEKVDCITSDEANRRLLILLEPDFGWLLPFDGDGRPVKFKVPADTLRGALSPDGRSAVLGSNNGALAFFDPSAVLDGKPAHFVIQPGHSDLTAGVFSVGGGQYFLTSSWDRTTRLWTLSGRQQLILDGRVATVSSDGSRALLQQGSKLSLLKVIPPAECPAVSDAGPGNIRSVRFSPDGKVAAVSSTGREKDGLSGGTLLCRLPELTPVARLGRSHAESVFLRDGSRLLTAGEGTAVWPLDGLETKDVRFKAVEAGRELAAASTQCVAASADGRWFASAMGQDMTAEHKRIRLFRQDGLEPGAVIGLPPEHAAVSGLQFGPDGRWLVSSYWKGVGFDVWDCGTGARTTQCYAEADSVNLSLNPDGSLLATASAYELKIWSTSDWTCVRTVPLPTYSAFAHAVAWSPDGGRIACEGERGKIQIMDPGGGAVKWILTLSGNDPVSHIDWSPDGRTLAVSTAQQSFFFDLGKMSRQLEALGLSALD